MIDLQSWPGVNLPELIQPGRTSLGIEGADATLLRLDTLHPVLSGNKLYKLLGHLRAFADSGHRRLLSFGGVYSNHLHALAALAQQADIPLLLLVRGYESAPLTATLKDCQDWGAELLFCDRKTYARRYERQWQQYLAQTYDAWVVPEGGSGVEGELGCRLLAPILHEYDEVWLACGTGTTALGLARALAESAWAGRLVGVNAVADQGELRRQWQRQMPPAVRWHLLDNAHGGGFARLSPEVRDIIKAWDARGIPFDPVYTAKMMLAFQRYLASGEASGKRILLIHTGGLQGRRGFDLSYC